jgi:opacity protein-like surface antigen
MRTSMILASLVALSGVAAAEPSLMAATPQNPYAFGVRIGGYGFHREGTGGWDECRMSGAGVFADHGLRGPLYLEAGLDAYSTTGQYAATDLPIDRQSALLSVAGGVRTHVTSWLRMYAQIGTGVELARLSVPYGDGSTIRADKVMPDGFLGVGLDLKLWYGIYLGAQMRTLVMGNFNYDPQRLQMANQWVAQPSSSDVFSASPALAAQGQFYLRKEL